MKKCLFPVVLMFACIFNSTVQAQTLADSLNSENYRVYIPNSFTPNNDGVNDVFNAYSEFVKDFSLRIYDKKGEEIFATSQITLGWNGEYKNKDMKQDSYLYRIDVGFLDGSDQVYIGHLNLFR